MFFRLGYYLWRIEIVSPNNPYLMRDDGTYALACTDDYLKTIFIRCGLSRRKFRHVLVHELAHAYCFEKHVLLNPYEEEILCNFTERFADDVWILACDILNNLT